MKKVIIMAVALGANHGTYASDVPEAVSKAVENRFPGAVVKNVEQDTWKGQSVTEVELTDKDGKQFEVLLSPDQEILSAEEEKGLLLPEAGTY